MSGSLYGDSASPVVQRVIVAGAFMHEYAGVRKILLVRRAKTKQFLPGAYELPGGHVAFGEDIVSGLKRNIAEKLHVHITVGDPFAVFSYVNTARMAHSVKVVYFTRLLGQPESIALDSQDYSSCRWLALDELHMAVWLQNRAEFAAAARAFTLFGGQSLSFG